MGMQNRIALSKSKYCRGIQCPKILWMDMYKPDEAENVLPEAVLATGNEVGDLARNYFGEYSLVEYSYDKQAMVEQTKAFMDAGAENIAEASFIVDGLYCAVDILHRTEEGWDIVEVKSSTHVTDTYVEDMAFQNYVLTECGIRVTGIFNMHIDNSYVFHDKLDLQGLFALVDYTEVCKRKYAAVRANINSIRSFVNTEEEPVRDIDICCDSPYECAYKKYCWRHIPENSIFSVRGLHSGKKYDYYHQGIVSYEDIIEAQPAISPKQMKQVETAFYHSPDKIEKEPIREFLDTLNFPVYHLDFETFQLAVPKWEGCRPYEQIPFQYSLHIEQEDGALEHKEFLAKEGTDPRRALAESLCRDIPMNVCSLAYNMAFERRVIRGLAELYPDLSEHLLNIRENMHDLMVPFQKQNYYTEAMEGSYSIKYVLPALYPNEPSLDYHNLEDIHHGGEASEAFANMEFMSPEDIERTRKNLLKYCGLDTFAMVKVLEKLKEVSR
jgi:hypothetical protein